jgi:2-iminobutanoate/2-iminopropanoate deaminase
MKEISTDATPKAIGPYSQAIMTGGILYTSGQVGLTPDGELVGDDIRMQTRQVLTNLSEVLKAAGGTLDDVIKTTVYLTDMDDFLAMNTIYAEFFGDHKPARSTVAVRGLPKNVKVEMDCIAQPKNYAV